MTPDDSLEIDGHTFYVSAYFDETVITQMSLEVDGDIVAVYPEKKEFTAMEVGFCRFLLCLWRNEICLLI